MEDRMNVRFEVEEKLGELIKRKVLEVTEINSEVLFKMKIGEMFSEMETDDKKVVDKL
jgi:hypothetical protein